MIQRTLFRQIGLIATLQFAAVTPLLPLVRWKVDSTLIADLVLAFGFYFSVRAGREVERTRLDVPVVVFLVLCSLATLFSVNRLLSVFPSTSRGDGLLVYLVYGAMALMAARFTPREVSVLIHGLLIAGVLIGGIAILQYYGLDATHLFRDKVLPFTRSWGTLGNPIFLGGYLTLLVPLGLTLTMHASGGTWRWYLAACVAMYAALVASQTRSAWVACAAGAALLARLLPASPTVYRRWGALVVACTAVTAVMVLTRPQLPLGQRVLSTLDPQDASVQGRLFVWRSVIPLVLHRPVLGWGFSTLLSQHPGMDTPLYFKVFGDQPLAPDTVHNEILHIAFANGLLGLGAYLWIWATMFRSLRTAVTSTRTEPVARSWGVGLIGAMAGYFVWLQLGWSVIGPANVWWALVGVAVALERIIPQPPHPAPREETGRPTDLKRPSGFLARFAPVEPLIIIAALAVLIVSTMPTYRAMRDQVADEERLEAAEGWHLLRQTAHEEARQIAQRWRSLAWACFLRTSSVTNCSSNNAIGFHDTAVNWQFKNPTYVSTPTSVTILVSGTVDDPFVAGEHYTMTLKTPDGTTSDAFIP